MHATEKIVQVAEWTTLREHIPQYAGSGATTNARTFIEGATLQELPRPSSVSMPRNRGNQRRYRDMDAPAEIANRLQKGLDVLLDQTQGNSEAYDGEATFTTFTRSRTHHHHRVCRSTNGNERALRFTAERSLILSLAIDERLVSSAQHGHHS